MKTQKNTIGFLELQPFSNEEAVEFWCILHTKEGLCPSEVLRGLLDYGLFPEKIPPCFSSKGLTDFARESFEDKVNQENNKRRNITNLRSDYIVYQSLRDSNIPRNMGIPHPAAYAIQALAISQHWEEIAKHCNKPNPIFSRIHVRRMGDGHIFEMNYKGNECLQQEEDELGWQTGAQYVVTADISMCFPSIYTHSIPWALHGKDLAKSRPTDLHLTGNLLDICTQNTRDSQTNGLLIGPHASNIISEIILTSIDVTLQEKGYKKVKRHIDDYQFYASNFEEAERFITDLGLALRTYEMSLNAKKTKVLPLPRPSAEDWILTLNRFQFPKDREIRFSDIRSYLDLALTCAKSADKSTPLNYAIKVLSRMGSAADTDQSAVNIRAKRMYTQEAINLALAYPYLTPLLDKYVFQPYKHYNLKDQVATFVTAAVALGIKKLYPDIIAHAIFLAMKYDCIICKAEEMLIKAIELEDCLVNVLALKYAHMRELSQVQRKVIEYVKDLKNDKSKRNIQKNWLLIYEVWGENDLRGNGQEFLAHLKSQGFQFFKFPEVD